MEVKGNNLAFGARLKYSWEARRYLRQKHDLYKYDIAQVEAAKEELNGLPDKAFKLHISEDSICDLITLKPAGLKNIFTKAEIFDFKIPLKNWIVNTCKKFMEQK